MIPQVITISIPPDNYSYILFFKNDAAVIDPSDAEAVIYYLKKMNLNLKFILATHHHSDHTSGIKHLKKSTGALVYGGDKRIPAIDRVLRDEDVFAMGEIEIKVLSMPGHTRGQVAYYLYESHMVFTGDILFGAGCGRIFEGSPDQMYNSLMRLSELPGDTIVYFGHEYTLENLEFAITVDAENAQVKDRLDKVRQLRSHKEVTVPSSIALERETNPFLRVRCKSIRKYLNMIDRSPVAVFAELRNRKNNF